MIHHVLVLSSVGIEMRVLAVVALVAAMVESITFMKQLNLNRAIAVVDNLVLSLMMVSATVLISPEKL